MVRRMPDSLVIEFGPKLAQMDWSFLAELPINKMVEEFETAASRLVDQTFPTKQITIIEGDQPFFTEEKRVLRRQRDRVYQRAGKSVLYHSIQKKFQTKLKNEARKYKLKIIEEVRNGTHSSASAAIRKLGETSADRDQRKELKIPAYLEDGLTPQESANRLASHFSAISQTVAPLDVANFHPALRQTIERGLLTKDKPVLTQHQVYRKILRIKKPNSSVAGDIPKKLVQKYPFLWAGPATTMFNKIIQTADWPLTWKIEHAFPLHKTENPSQVSSEDDVRTISKTSFISKLLENLLCDWLLPIVEPYLDPGQCGGLRKSSINHYLIKLLDFIHETIDLQTPHAVVLAALDLSKAYNRGDSYVIQDLHDMHTPGWLLAILCSYLSSRSMVLTYQKTESAKQYLPGGYGAGTLMGGFLFIIKFNGICLRPPPFQDQMVTQPYN